MCRRVWSPPCFTVQGRLCLFCSRCKNPSLSHSTQPPLHQPLQADQPHLRLPAIQSGLCAAFLWAGESEMVVPLVHLLYHL